MYEKGQQLFALYGLKKTSVDDLVQAVGISKGAFYLFYGSKEELLFDILEQIETELQTSVLLGLAMYADRKAGTLSMGNLQWLGLACAMLHEPALLILAEPANGLDPAGFVEIRELLRRLAHEQGVTIFMSSHILTEVDRLATRIGIIHQGRLIEELAANQVEALRTQPLIVA